jgi:hypothetical protein
LEVKEGRDPLGLQTTTMDRLMPFLLPGILELSRRARYFSFHAFLLAEYRDRRMPAEGKALSTFIKRREWDLGLAVQRCPRHCGSGPVGARKLGGIALGSGPFPRGESVESAFGGYGLYYRSPLVELGIVARAGTLLGEKPIPIDVLRETPRAQRLAATFKAAVEHTTYYQRAMLTSDDLSADVIDEYAEVACLCRLRDQLDERAAVHDAVFGTDDATPAKTVDDALPVTEGLMPLGLPLSDAGVLQRRCSAGHYLSLVEADPRVVRSEAAYREALWSPPAPRSDRHAAIAGQWSALVAKDVWQEAICSVWSEFCRKGLSHTRELGRGLTWEETHYVASELVTGPPVLAATSKTLLVVKRLEAGTFVMPDLNGAEVNVGSISLEELRQLTVRLDTTSSGLVTLLELARRIAGRSGLGWETAAHIESGWQPSVAAVVAGLRTHQTSDPLVGDTIWWLVSRFIIPVHERIAYSKLPEFTFRFRWEDGLLRFYDQGIGRFPLAAIRFETLALVTHDLGLWDNGEEPAQKAGVTAAGAAFIKEALA